MTEKEEEQYYTISLANGFDAESPEDAVKQFVAWMLDYGAGSGFRVKWNDENDCSHTVFIDGDDLGIY